jgi:hypothetical protein
MRAPAPSAEGFMSTQQKMSLADIALKLRDEQLEAKVVHYKADLETNSELDAITAQVVAELQNLQKAVKSAGPAAAAPTPQDRAQVEIELIQSLKEMLSRTFRQGKLAPVFERKLGEVSKRFARVFFASELHEKIRGSDNEQKVMRFKEQALYVVFTRSEDHMLKQLDALNYASPDICELTKEKLVGLVREMRNDFLSRTTPELNQLVKFLNLSLSTFFTDELPPMVGELAWEVVKEARLADARVAGGGYKIPPTAFPTFRQVFERQFLQRLVPFACDDMLRRVRESGTTFREETIRFVADPEIFSEVCDVFCETIYDMLYNDGFLDLPSDWRARLSAGA